jgi:peroxiredoxin Q/BCP
MLILALVYMMISRRNFLSTVLTCCFAILAWLNFAPVANALGGKLPSINQPAPEFTYPPTLVMVKFHSPTFAASG